MSLTLATIRKAHEKYEAREAKKIQELQHKCKHLHIGHWEGRLLTGSLTEPKRICLDCGLEETGSWWSYAFDSHWNRVDFARALLGNKRGRSIKEITLNELNQARI